MGSSNSGGELKMNMNSTLTSSSQTFSAHHEHVYIRTYETKYLPHFAIKVGRANVFQLPHHSRIFTKYRNISLKSYPPHVAGIFMSKMTRICKGWGGAVFDTYKDVNAERMWFDFNEFSDYVGALNELDEYVNEKNRKK